MQNSANNTSRGENGEIKNEYSSRKRLDMSWVPSPIQKKKKKAKICVGDQTLEVGAEGEEEDWALAGVSSSPK